MNIYTKAELVVKTDDDQFADLYGVSVIRERDGDNRLSTSGPLGIK